MLPQLQKVREISARLAGIPAPQPMPVPPYLQPSTQPSGQPDVFGTPVVKAPPKVTRLKTGRPTRVMYDHNPTPVFGANPAWVDDGKSTEPDAKGNWRYTRINDSTAYMQKHGFEPSFMVYNGTENRAKLWWDTEREDFRVLRTPAGLNRPDLDWGKSNNFTDPLDPSVVKGIVKLSRNPWVFGADLPPYRAIVLDIEGTQTYNGDTPTPLAALRQIQAWDARLSAYTAGGYLQELYSYMDPGLWPRFQDKWDLSRLDAEQLDAYSKLKEADQRMMRKLTGMNVSLYNWDVTVENPGVWFTQVDQITGQIDSHYPYHKHNKWACIHPQYDVYWPQNLQDRRNLDKAGKLIPLDLWETQVKYLVDRGWHIYLWLPTIPLERSKKYIDVVAKYHTAR
jgi:hypothetical protein